nr:immunoglobulin heavy chain junction region [Mus musculus]
CAFYSNYGAMDYW